MTFPVQQLRPVRVRRDIFELRPGFRLSNLSFGAIYLVIGEVADTGHYILLHKKDGRIVPGMFHSDDFETVSKDEL